MKKLYFFLLSALLMVANNVNAQKDAEHPWAGNYTLMLVDDEPFHYLPEEAAKYITSVPDTFEVGIEWNAEKSQYFVTKFYDFATDSLTLGGFELKIIDDKTAEIQLVDELYHVFAVTAADTTYEETETGYTATITPAGKAGLLLSDGSNNVYGKDPVKIYMNSDGQISIDPFKVIYKDPANMGWYAWTDGATPLNGGDEPVAVEPRNSAGYYSVKADAGNFISMDGNAYNQEGAFEVAADGFGNYIVTKFMGYNTEEANAMSGGIYLTPSKKDANKATIDCDAYMNLLQSEDGMSGLALFNDAGKNGSIKISFDEATQTITFDMFCYAYVNMMGQQTADIAAWCFSATATVASTDGIASVNAQRNASTEVYDLTGRRVMMNNKGLYIKNGRVIVK